MKLLHRTICLAVVLFLPPAICADTVTLVSSRDTTIYQMHPHNSDGAGQAMAAGTTGEPSFSRALVGFDIAGNVPAGSTISRVQLRLTLEKRSSNEFVARQIQLRRLLADWGEGAAGGGSDGAGSGNGFPTPADGTAATWTHRFFDTVRRSWTPLM